MYQFRRINASLFQTCDLLFKDTKLCVTSSRFSLQHLNLTPPSLLTSTLPTTRTIISALAPPSSSKVEDLGWKGKRERGSQRVSERCVYRVTLVVVHLGGVDLDMGSSHGCSAAIVATYFPSRMVEHPKYKSTQPGRTTTCVTLYVYRCWGRFRLSHPTLIRDCCAASLKRLTHSHPTTPSPLITPKWHSQNHTKCRK